ncbi:MAG: hypothetical protein KBT36_16795 [Kurthia sp.]|nr:hypothetical protein [Candidatus Kurthia equi]
MFMFYTVFVFGVLMFFLSIVYLVLGFIERFDSYFQLICGIFVFAVGVCLLCITVPNLKEFILRDFQKTVGSCVVDYAIGGREKLSYDITFENGEVYFFDDVPYLESYGKKHVYYCEVQHTKNKRFEIDYKIFNQKGGRLIAPEY